MVHLTVVESLRPPIAHSSCSFPGIVLSSRNGSSMPIAAKRACAIFVVVWCTAPEISVLGSMTWEGSDAMGWEAREMENKPG